MPYKKRTTKRRSYKKKARSSYISNSVGPQTLIRKLRYNDIFSLDAGVGTTATHKFRANDLFDPDFTGTGHQPTGFDQYMLMYDHFKIIGSKINVKFMGPQASNQSRDAIIGAIYLDDDSTALTDIRVAIENGLTSWGIQGSGGGTNPLSLFKTFSNKKFFASKKTSAEVTGSSSASPAEIAFYTVCVAALDGSTDIQAYNCMVTIDYVVEFTERKTLALS